MLGMGTPSLGASGSVDCGLYWRVWFAHNDGGNGNTAQEMYIYPAIGNNANLTTLSGNITGSIIGWGIVSEDGAFPTTYIPTSSLAVTRAADVAIMTGANFSNWFNATEGTVVVEFETPAVGTRPIISFDDNSANNSIILYTDGTDLKFAVTTGGVAQCVITAGTVAANTPYKVAASWIENNFGVSLAGAAAVTDVSGTIPTVDRARLGSDQAGNYLNGPIRSVLYFDKQYGAALLQGLSAP